MALFGADRVNLISIRLVAEMAIRGTISAGAVFSSGLFLSSGHQADILFSQGHG